MYVYTNPNPIKKLTGDCVIRAIAILTNQSWEDAYMELCKEGLLMADLPNANSVWASYLHKQGYKRKAIPDTCPDCYTIGDFSIDNPNGRYALCTGSHLVAVISGDILDAWDSSREIPAYFFYKED